MSDALMGAFLAEACTNASITFSSTLARAILRTSATKGEGGVDGESAGCADTWTATQEMPNNAENRSVFIKFKWFRSAFTVEFSVVNASFSAMPFGGERILHGLPPNR